MSLFSRKATIVLKTMQQRDAFIERLEKAHVSYDVKEDKASIYSPNMTFCIRVKADDLKKVG